MPQLDERVSRRGTILATTSRHRGRAPSGAPCRRWGLAVALAASAVACSTAQPPLHRAEIDRAWLGADALHTERGHGQAARLPPNDPARAAGAEGGTAGEPTAEAHPGRREDSDDPDFARPPRRRMVSLELRDAPLDEVLRFLADAGGFGLVLGATGAGVVEVSLHRVEPFDALVTIAESNGFRVRYADGVAVVSPP